MTHPAENDLALLAGGDIGPVQRFLLNRHVENCADCQVKLTGYSALRSELADSELPDLNWNFLAADMRANIRLGLEAGACVRASNPIWTWRPQFTVAFASLLLLAGASLFVREARVYRASEPATPVLRMTGLGVELRTGRTSLILLNSHGTAANQTVSAQGGMGTRYIDGETESVTINNVYLQ
jgi:hypothetical protein